ncbi:MAG TPA: PilZ domain-containing protein [Acetivibrio sp.]|nr:PilZ domain-containing protein [Clostridium sp.]HQA56322.1 PilZ domain-containing protein [Acetivibrio sp.]
MSGYNLDDNKGIFSLLESKNLIKLIKLGSPIDVKHFKMYEYINCIVIEKSENDIKLEMKDNTQETLFFPGDHVVLNYSNNDELYVIDGTIIYVFSINPPVIKVRMNKCEKLKNLRKHERYYVSLMANIRVSGCNKPFFAVVKNMSSGGIKINCNELLSTDDVLEVEVILDRTNKLVFSGAVVRKNKLGNYYEYGIEIKGISESNIKCLYHYLKWLGSEYR